MNRRRLFALLPAMPVVGVGAIAAAASPKVEPTNVRLPRPLEANWGAIINKAIRDLEVEVNKLKGAV